MKCQRRTAMFLACGSRHAGRQRTGVRRYGQTVVQEQERDTQAGALTLAPRSRATAAEAIITVVMARWRPNFSAASLPKMLSGMDRMAKKKLTVTGDSQDRAP